MGHHHHGASCAHHAPTKFHKAFALGALLNTAFVVIEFFFGYYAQSLALVADAAHNLGDVLALLFAWLGYHLTQRAPSYDSRFTFGLGRVSIYATVFNGLTLVVSSVWIIVEAVERFMQPASPMPYVVGLVALIGIIINAATAWLLAKGQDDVNIKGAMLHMIADALVSVGVVIAAVFMVWMGWAWIDPAVSVLIATLILWSGWPLLREGFHLSLDAVPGHLNRADIKAFFDFHPDLNGVHSIHIWALSTSKTALSAHICPKPGVDTDALLSRLRSELESRFKLTHVTLQIENDPKICPVSSD